MKFVMMKDRTVASKFGRAFAFEKGKPLHVPQMCWEEVQAAGAVPEDELPEPAAGAPVVPTGQARTDAIKAAIKAVVLKAQRDDFAASGAPKVGPLVALTGFEVDAKERDVIWTQMQTEGTE